MKTYVTTYGSEGVERGIVEISYDINKKFFSKKLVIELDGKCNFVTKDDQKIYLSLEKDGKCYICVYDNKSFKLLNMVESKYFYSYGQKCDDYLLLASYSSGVDSLFDTTTNTIVKECLHGISAKSHFIKRLADGSCVGIENGLSQLYFYNDYCLEVKSILPIENTGIRLMSFNKAKTIGYINTEKTNEIVVVDLINKKVLNRKKISEQLKTLSGGNSIDLSNNKLVVSQRFEDCLYVYDIVDEVELKLNKIIPCGQIPRDLFIEDGVVFVSCTNENSIEAYDILTGELLSSVDVYKPITFMM